jgi:HK97 family phage portal protein
VSIAAKARAAWKAITASQMRFPAQGLVMFNTLDRVTLNEVETQVGDGTGSDVIMSPVRWLQGAMAEAPLVEADKKDDAPVEGSTVTKLLEEPNAFYDGINLLAATTYSLCLDGNAYWLPVGTRGAPDSLWWAPSHLVEPHGTTKQLITHYRYTAGGETRDYDPKDVIHFRDGVDPRDQRIGLSPLRALLREVWTDDEAARFASQLLSNGGVPGLVLSPKMAEYQLTKDEADALRGKIETRLTGEGRGRTLVLGGPVDVEQFGYSPQQMDLSPLRNIGEERVCAMLGIPAAVVGFGSGLEQTKVGATMREMRQLAWLGGVIRLQRIIAGELSRYFRTRVLFDNSQVAALSESEDAVAARVERLVRAGVMSRAEARADLGLEVRPTDEVYLMSPLIAEVPVTGREEEPVPEPVPDEPDPEKGTKHNASLTEQRIIETARRVTNPPAVLGRAARAMDRLRTEAAGLFAEPLSEFFAALGAQAEQIASRVFTEPKARKQSSEELAILLDGLDLVAAEEELARIMADSYRAVALRTAGGMSSALGIAIELTDAEQVRVLQAGGLRAGLIDLSAQTRDAIFDALASGRESGLAGDNLARHIREHVEAGPWRDAATRARDIARTEGANAANISSLSAARSMQAEFAMVHDNRTGFDDDVCSAIDGTVVTLAEAEALGLAHPNCTRSFTPIPALLAEEMGLVPE